MQQKLIYYRVLNEMENEKHCSIAMIKGTMKFIKSLLKKWPTKIKPLKRKIMKTELLNQSLEGRYASRTDEDSLENSIT